MPAAAVGNCRRYKHPNAQSGFYTPALATAFREAAYVAANVSKPPGWAQRLPPRTITYLMSPGAEQVGWGGGG